MSFLLTSVTVKDSFNAILMEKNLSEVDLIKRNSLKLTMILIRGIILFCFSLITH